MSEEEDKEQIDVNMSDEDDGPPEERRHIFHMYLQLPPEASNCSVDQTFNA